MPQKDEPSKAHRAARRQEIDALLEACRAAIADIGETATRRSVASAKATLKAAIAKAEGLDTAPAV